MKKLGLPFSLVTVRAVSWTVFTLHRLRRDLPTQGLEVRLRPPSAVTLNGVQAVVLTLRMRRATCLERSLILQRWLMACGQRYEVLVGVAGGGSVEAHAWIDHYDPENEGKGFQVLARVAPGG